MRRAGLCPGWFQDASRRPIRDTARRPDGKDFYERQKSIPDQVWPLVRTHPATGRKALYVSPRFTIGIEGMSEAEADSILDELFAHQIRPEFTYRHKWRDHDLAIWDNRCVIHHATGGYAYPESQTPWQEIQRSLVDELANGMVLKPAVAYQRIAQPKGVPRHNH